MVADGWSQALRRAGRGMAEDDMFLIAKALAFSTFLALPSLLLVVVGLFTLLAEGSQVDRLIADLDGDVPDQARELLASSLRRLADRPHTSAIMTGAGFVVALASLTSAMTNYMTALDIAYEREDRRSFLRRRLVALQLVGCLLLVAGLVAGVLLAGHEVAEALGVSGVWSVVRWPVVPAGLLLAFAVVLFLGPDLDERSWRVASPGALVAVAAWLVSSGALAFYAAHFGSYDETWGSLSAVIVALVWLWLGSVALLYGAELDSELDGRGADDGIGPRPTRGE